VAVERAVKPVPTLLSPDATSEVSYRLHARRIMITSYVRANEAEVFMYFGQLCLVFHRGTTRLGQVVSQESLCRMCGEVHACMAKWSS
jgi:hypothetical protein